MSSIYKLDFLLSIETHDHQIVNQPPDDKSRTDPKRTFFYDIKDLHIKKASLIGKGQILTLDLEDGFATLNGQRINPPNQPPIKVPLEFIYYRQVQQNTNQGFEIQKEKNKLFIEMFQKNQSRPSKVKYFIGWKAKYMGKNYKFELGME